MLKTGAITTQQHLLTRNWSADVQALDATVRAFADVRDVRNDCGITFFEMDGDSALHVNVTHRHKTATARGWAGPASVRDGFVHNRKFAPAAPEAIVRDIRAMVFSPRLKVRTA